MGYAVYEIGNNRWGGYGVPAFCDHPDCNEEIDHGMAYACGGEPFSERGCAGYFCSKHRTIAGFNGWNEICKHSSLKCKCEWTEVCERCAKGEPPFDFKAEHPDWAKHVLKDKSWAKWRKENKSEVQRLRHATQPSSTSPESVKGDKS